MVPECVGKQAVEEGGNVAKRDLFLNERGSPRPRQFAEGGESRSASGGVGLQKDGLRCPSVRAKAQFRNGRSRPSASALPPPRRWPRRPQPATPPSMPRKPGLQAILSLGRPPKLRDRPVRPPYKARSPYWERRDGGRRWGAALPRC